ncbi:MAG: sodium-dependent transporter [Peptococcaceae bacterium]|nr:sodium-dependent transporter [Peptococcaceae bacterium]
MSEKQRERFSSRLGFILVSAGCAIGIGNVWKFPYLCGQFGGASFILIYLFFLLILGIPVMVCELAIGRKSQKSAARAFNVLEPKGTQWHQLKFITIIGCYLLMMFYTTVTGWMMAYCVKQIKGDFVGATPDQVAGAFGDMLAGAGPMIFWTLLTCVIGTVVCVAGIKNGVEKASKFMMVALLLLIVVLAIRSVTLDGAGAGIRFYLVPDFGHMAEIGMGNVIYAAMSQAFFTLSLGIGAMLIFGSYIGKERSLAGEAITITALDTFVAIMSGFIIIPACFAFNIEPDAGPSLIFVTIPNLFAQMPGGQFWGALFFLFLSFASLTTIIAVFENIISFTIDNLGWERKKSAYFNGIMIAILSLPCVLGYNLWSTFQPLGEGSAVLDLEDFIVSNNLLPLGSLAFVLFCTRKTGWSWPNFISEVNSGKGINFPANLHGYMSFVLPLIIIVVYLKGYYDKFAPMGTSLLVGWMIFALALIAFIFFPAIYQKKSK